MDLGGDGRFGGDGKDESDGVERRRTLRATGDRPKNMGLWRMAGATMMIEKLGAIVDGRDDGWKNWWREVEG